MPTLARPHMMCLLRNNLTYATPCISFAASRGSVAQPVGMSRWGDRNSDRSLAQITTCCTVLPHQRACQVPFTVGTTTRLSFHCHQVVERVSQTQVQIQAREHLGYRRSSTAAYYYGGFICIARGVRRLHPFRWCIPWREWDGPILEWSLAGSGVLMVMCYHVLPYATFLVAIAIELTGPCAASWRNR